MSLYSSAPRNRNNASIVDLLAAESAVTTDAINSLTSTLTAVDSNVTTLGDEFTALSTHVSHTDTSVTIGGVDDLNVNIATGSHVQAVNIGTGAGVTTINLGGAGDTVNVSGTLTTINTTNLDVQDKLIRVNKGGSTATAFGSGIEVEEDGVATGYIKTSGDRTAFLVKAPNGSEFTLGQVIGVTTATADTLVQRDGTGGGNFTGVVAVNGVNSSTLTAGELFANNASLIVRTQQGVTAETEVNLTLGDGVKGSNLITQRGYADARLTSRNQSTNAFQNGIIRMETRDANKFNAINPTEFHMIDQNSNIVTRIGSSSSNFNTGTLSCTGGMGCVGLLSSGSLTVNLLDLTPAETTCTANFLLGARSYSGYTFTLRRIGKQVFFYLPPSNVANATQSIGYFWANAEVIPAAFRPGSAPVFCPCTVIKNITSFAGTISISTGEAGSFAIELLNGAGWNNGETARWNAISGCFVLP